MKIFLDVDALHKLASYGALHHALALLGVSSADVWVPSTARFKLRLNKPAEALRRHGELLARALSDFITSANEITEGPSASETAQLEGVVGIDAGELLLIAMVARHEDSVLVTGDKNALRALATDTKCSAMAARLSGRVVCLEQLMKALTTQRGFEWLHQCVGSAPGADRSMSLIVSPGVGATEAKTNDGFKSFIGALRSETGSLLRALPPFDS